MKIARHRQESAEYAAQRDELLEAEIALRDQRERVAELRRKLRPEPCENYTLREVLEPIGSDGPVQERKLSELFEASDKPLVLMHFMFGGAQEEPCPMCSSWADGYDGIVPHLEQRSSFGVVFEGDLREMRAYAHGRGWRNVRLISSAGSSLKRDFGFENADGSQNPGVSVFLQGGDGVQHFYSASAYLGEAGFRGMDLLNPLWHFFDLMPEGRGDFMPRKSY